MEPSSCLENRGFLFYEWGIKLEPICASCFSYYRYLKEENLQYY